MTLRTTDLIASERLNLSLLVEDQGVAGLVERRVRQTYSPASSFLITLISPSPSMMAR
jgi:hypothetical protein